MNKMQQQVQEFHLAFTQPVGIRAHMLPEERKELRLGLIEEELEELAEALEDDDLVETADACIDILYVTFGLLVEMGVDAQPLFDEVQRSNMSKLGADGKPIYSRGIEQDGYPAGKVLKGPDYFRPNLRKILAEQRSGVA